MYRYLTHCSLRRGWNSCLHYCVHQIGEGSLCRGVGRHRCCLSHECQRRGYCAGQWGRRWHKRSSYRTDHVVSGATEIVVRQAADARSRETYRLAAKLTAQNETRDLCVLFVDELSIPPAAKPVPLGVARNVSYWRGGVRHRRATRTWSFPYSRGIISQLSTAIGGIACAAPILQTDDGDLAGLLWRRTVRPRRL